MLFLVVGHVSVFLLGNLFGKYGYIESINATNWIHEVSRNNSVILLIYILHMITRVFVCMGEF